MEVHGAYENYVSDIVAMRQTESMPIRIREFRVIILYFVHPPAFQHHGMFQHFTNLNMALNSLASILLALAVHR